MGAMSRRKGSAFERTIAKQLSEWLKFQVSRTPSSGAYGTREGWSSLSGDLMFAKEFPYYCELKCRETFSLEDVLHGKGPFWDWWKKTCEESREHGKRPILICKRNRHQPLFFVDDGDLVVHHTHSAVPLIRAHGVCGYPLHALLRLNPSVL